MLEAMADEPVPDTVVLLDEFVVNARRIDRYSAGLLVSSVDLKAYETQPDLTLSGYLSSQSAIFIKTYGAGGLASISIRGTAPQHTGVYWNGFSINPPNIQMADLSLFPLFLFSRVDIVSGGSSALFGNGSMGGSVHLNSQEGGPENQLRATTGLGQFNDKLLALKAGFFIKRLQYSGSMWYNNAENEFKYINTAKFGNPQERLTNADAKNFGMIQELKFAVTNSHQLRGGIWYQDKEAGIPPSMTMLRSVARQHDRQQRGYLQWDYSSENFSQTIKTAYNRDFLRYADSSINLDSRIETGVWISEVESAIKLLNSTRLSAGLNAQAFNAAVDAYMDDVNPFQFSVFMLASHEFPELPWTITAGIRKEFHSDFQHIPPAVSLGGAGKFIKNLNGRFNLSTNYRIPTLNDRYWQPGGNAGLKPESGINGEAGLDLKLDKEKLASLVSGTIFISRIKNWITWLPAIEGYWKPENVEGVFIYGVELKAQNGFEIQETKHRTEFIWACTRSIYGASNFSEILDSPQLIYTPVFTGTLGYHLSWKQWMLHYNHQYTGERYTDRANTNRLPAFHSGNGGLTKTTSFKNIKLSVNLLARNIWNQKYQVIEFRPMPGRSLYISLIIDFLPSANTKS